MLRPVYLQPGDKVALISPSGHVTREELEDTHALLASWGLIPVTGQHALARHGKMAGTDTERLYDLQAALDAEEVRAIWCTTGGYGTLRMLEDADYSIFQGNPKWVIGMNDITVLHSKLHSLGIESLHAFMPSTYRATAPEAVTRLRDFLFGMISPYATSPHPLNREGIAESELVGGMLDRVHGLRGTCIEHNTRGTILFIEDPSNDLEHLDQCIRCMQYAGKFQYLAGLVAGRFGTNATPTFKEQVYHAIRKAVEDYDYPVCFNFPAGHTQENFPILLGANATLVVREDGCELQFP